MSSLIRAVVLQFCTIFVFISIQSFNPFHPLTWISSSIGLLITPTSWFYDFIAIFTVAGIGLFYSKQLNLYPWIARNQMANFTRLFLPPILISFLAHFGAGGILMRSYLGLLGGNFNSLAIFCEQSGQKCLNVPHLFLVLSGCFSALMMWRDFHFGNANLVQFPMIALTGNAQLGRQVSGLIRNSVESVMLNTRWFLILYLTLGKMEFWFMFFYANIFKELSCVLEFWSFPCTTFVAVCVFAHMYWYVIIFFFLNVSLLTFYSA